MVKGLTQGKEGTQGKLETWVEVKNAARVEYKGRREIWRRGTKDKGEI